VTLVFVALIAGLTGGFLDAMAGAGFGAVSASLLAAGGAGASTAVVSVNLAKVASGLSGAVAHIRLRNVKLRWVVTIAASGVAGALTGGTVAGRLDETALRTVMHSFLLAAGVLMGVLAWRQARLKAPASVSGGAIEVARRPEEAGTWARLCERHSQTALWVGIGFAAGFANTVAGAFGPVVMCGLLFSRRVHPRYVVGSVTVAEIVVALTGIVSLAVLFGDAAISPRIVLPLAIGGVVAAPVGALMARRMPARVTGMVISGVLIGVNVLALVRG
jgi:uncharacterized membrane protein YfcA